MKKINHRAKNKKIAVSIITCLFLMIVSVSIAYAALSETLTISGSGKVNASNWNIRISNSNEGNRVFGDASYKTPVVNGTTISYSVNLSKPGDSVILYFDVINDGDLNGEVTSIVNSTPVCTSETGNAQDAALVCDNLEINMSYLSQEQVKIGDVINTDSYTCNNGSSIGYEETIIKVEIKLKDTMTAVPGSKITTSNLKHEFVYSQTNKSCTTEEYCFVAGTKVLAEEGYMPIEKIKKGEYVYALNFDTNNYELQQVTKKINTYANEIYEITVANKKIETTKKHRFYIVDKGWVKAEDLKIGDEISSKENDDTKITNIKIKPQKERIPVYNLEVEGHHNYLITEDNLLVHNGDSDR